MDAKLEEDVTQLWQMLFKIVLNGEKRLAAHIMAHGLTTPQFYVLKTLTEEGGECAIGHIARQHSLTNATMTGLIKRLEAMEPPLVRRERNPDDLRSINVVLTKEGRARFQGIQDDLVNQLRVVMQFLNEDDRREILEFLQRYVDLVMQFFPTDGELAN